MLFAALLVGATVAALLAASAFFSSAEIALFSLGAHRVDSLAASEPQGETLARLRADPHRLLVTVLVGNNLVNVAVSSVVTAALVAVLPPGEAVAVATGVGTVVILVVGEVLPKAYGVANAESWALRVAAPLSAFASLAAPLVALFDGVTHLANRLTGGGMDIERPYVTRDEIEALLRTGASVGAIGATERDLVTRVLRLSRRTAADLARPASAVDASAGLDTVVDVARRERLRRVPVTDDGRITGVVDLRDALRGEGARAASLVRPVVGVGDRTTADSLLGRLRGADARAAIVGDPADGSVRLVDPERVAAAVFGEVFD